MRDKRYYRAALSALIFATIGTNGLPLAATAVATPAPSAGAEPAFDACPHIWEFERGGDTEFYALVLRAKTAMTVDVTLRAFSGGKSYTAMLPGIAIVKPSDTQIVKFRSAPIVLRSPDATHAPILLVTFGGDDARCPAEARDTGVEKPVGYRPIDAFASLETSIATEAGNSGVHELREDDTPDVPACTRPNKAATVTAPVEPRYPDVAAQMGETGTSVALVVIDSHGVARDVETYQSSGSALLDRATIEGAKKSTYAAGTIACTITDGVYFFRAAFVAPYAHP